jgi:hypothetical protein
VFDKIDGKNTIYSAQPESYSENDLWFTENDVYSGLTLKYKKGTLLVALNNSDSFKLEDWAKKDTYTDDTAVTNLDTYVKGSFKDGILDEGEKSAIKEA